MADLTLPIDPEEFAGLVAVGELDSAAGEAAGVELVTKRLLRSALAARLDELDLPWSPSADELRERVAAAGPAEAAAEAATAVGTTAAAAAAGRTAATAGTAEPAATEAAETEAAPAAKGLAAQARRPEVRRWVLSILAVTVAVLLWGGYVLDWQWTGFQANAQVWDWMHLLLLPVVVGTVPLWIERPAGASQARRRMYWALMAAFAVFVAAGYLVPWPWTGFPGITLWGWFGLILLPVAVASARLFPAVITALRPHHRTVFGLAGVAWLVTVIGGYGLGWKWTGYPGNTLWDWLQMLLLPLVVPIILVPATLKWVTGTGTAAAGPFPAAAGDAGPARTGSAGTGSAGTGPAKTAPARTK